MIRRSRCQAVTLVIVVLQLVAFSLVHNSSKLGFTELHLDFSDLKVLFLPKKGTYSFNSWVDKIYRQNIAASDETANSLRMAKYALETKSNSNSVKIPKYLKGEEENPHLVPFDPRLTLGILLNRLDLRIGQDQNLELDLFHWSDWTDLTVLHEHMLSNNKQDCSIFARPVSNRNPVMDPSRFCINDKDLEDMVADNETDPSIKRSFLAMQSSPRTGFHVNKNAGRTSQSHRILQGASYMNDFLPAPMAVILLLPHASGRLNSLTISIKEEFCRVRLIDTAIATAVAQRVDTLDLQRELKSVTQKFTGKKPKEFAPTKLLKHEDFDFHHEARFQELSMKTDLTRIELSYFNSLFTSIKEQHPTKHFNEAWLLKTTKYWALGGHYDWRFFKGIVNQSDLRTSHLNGLTLAWLRFTNSNNLTTWIAHGSLLSWYWNGLAFPWDNDVDVQMPIAELHKLAEQFNQTLIVDFGSDPTKEVKMGRYLLDCGTWITHRTKGKGLNNIDARFIDLDSGLYIDITGLAVSNTFSPARYDEKIPKFLERTDHLAGKRKYVEMGQKPPLRLPDDRELERNQFMRLYNCRNNHFVSLSELSPLTLTQVEGVPAYAPKDFVGILQAEYREGGTGSKKFGSFSFLPRLRLWCDTKIVQRYIRNQGRTPGTNLRMGRDAVAAEERIDTLSIYPFSDHDYLGLMTEEPLLLVEYLVSRDVTKLHEEEMNALLNGKSTGELLLDRGALKNKFPSLRHDSTHYKSVKFNIDFNAKVDELAQMHISYVNGKPERPKENIDQATLGESVARPGGGHKLLVLPIDIVTDKIVASPQRLVS